MWLREVGGQQGEEGGQSRCPAYTGQCGGSTADKGHGLCSELGRKPLQDF